MPEFDDQNSPAGLAEVFASADPIQVRIASDLLDGGGIEAFVFDGVAARMLGSTLAVRARLMVHADCAVEARERLKELGFAD